MRLIWVVLVFFSCSLFAADRVSYCNGMFSFIPTKNLDINFIKLQSEAANCKNELKIKLKGNRQVVKLSFPSESNQLSIVSPTKEDLILAKGKSDKVINQSYLLSNVDGDVMVETFIILSKNGVIDSIEKFFYFSKKDVYSIYATYKINPEEKDEVIMLNDLEAFFLSIKVNWG